MYKYYWLAVTTDKYELPIAVRDTAAELGKVFGITKNAVFLNEMLGNGRYKKYKVIKVEREVEESEQV